MTEQLRVLEPQRQSLSLRILNITTESIRFLFLFSNSGSLTKVYLDSNIAAQLIKVVSSDDFHRIIEFQQSKLRQIRSNNKF